MKINPDELWDVMFDKLLQFRQVNYLFIFNAAHNSFQYAFVSAFPTVYLNGFCQDSSHSNVPMIYPEHSTLASWTNSQRVKYHLGKLSDECIDQLDEIGFDFHAKQGGPLDPSEETGEMIQLEDRESYLQNLWDSNYEKLKQYVEEHGHSQILINYEANPSLGAWAFSQKLAQKKKKLSGERFEKLMEVGFQF